MTKQLTYADFELTEKLTLKPYDCWDREAIHTFKEEDIVALIAAHSLRKPLLIKGEPGCGKTQLARAAAQKLKMPLVSLVVNERTETEDLFYRFDALRRLSDASSKNKSATAEKDYLTPGPLWLAFNHQDAMEKLADNKQETPIIDEQALLKDGRNFDHGFVLLIDEIDKADRAIPNSLLEAMGNLSFVVPYLNNHRVTCKTEAYPLIIITTNNEQTLPPAFERRCLVHNMKLQGKNKQAFIENMLVLAKSIHGDSFSDEDYSTIAGELYNQRQALPEGAWKPGQAEFLDHLQAVLALQKADNKMTRQKAMEHAARLTYQKHGA